MRLLTTTLHIGKMESMLETGLFKAEIKLIKLIK